MEGHKSHEEIFAERVRNIEISGIRKAFEAASSDFINLGLGEPDLDTPEHIKRAAIEALNSGFTSYTIGKGIEELRVAISEKFKRDNKIDVSPEDIIVTSGASEALHIAILSIVDEGDEVLIPDPGFVCYAALTKLAGGKPVSVPLREDDFVMSAEAVGERISKKSKALIINSPSNPTGAVFTEKDIKALVDIAKDHHLTIISDEVYEHLIYEEIEHVSPARFYENVITINAVSKTYAMTGFRLGYVAAPPEYIEQMLKIHQYIQACASSISQKAALAAIKGPQGCVREIREEFKRRRDFTVKALSRLGMKFPMPKGAFYVFPEVADEEEFVEKMLKNKIIVTPGSAFGEFGKNHIRLSYATSMEKLREAFKIMERVMGDRDAGR
ncbi:MAG: pyridoxal phosphate-dependent aminotransferase [Candidatus Methanospirareceae archaeon]